MTPLPAFLAAKLAPSPSPRAAAPAEVTSPRAVDRGVFVSLTLPLRARSEMNRREHWAARDKRRAAQRRVTLALLRTDVGRIVPGPVVVTLTRVGKRKMDSDNSIVGCKFIRDAIAEWLGCDDGDETRVQWKYAQRVAPAYAVHVAIARMDDPPAPRPVTKRRARKAGAK